MATIDLTGDDDAVAETLGPHDPRRRAVLRGGRKRGEALRAEIQKLKAQGLETHEIVERVKCSRAYVRKVLTQAAPTERIPAELLQRMVAELRGGADPAGLLDAIPEVGSLFKPRKGKPSSDERGRVLASLRVLISSGAHAQPGTPGRALYDARQAGKMKAGG